MSVHSVAATSAQHTQALPKAPAKPEATPAAKAPAANTQSTSHRVNIVI